MTLRDTDYRYLRGLDSLNVFGELVRLNTGAYYHKTLDVIKLYRELTKVPKQQRTQNAKK